MSIENWHDHQGLAAVMAMFNTVCCTVFCCFSSSRWLSSSSQVCSRLPSMLVMSPSISVSFRHGGLGGERESPLLHQPYNVGRSRKISRRFKSFELWGQRIKSPPSVEGARSSKLGFGADARTDEGKGSKEKKQ